MGAIIKKSLLIGEKEFTLETGRLARQANGAVFGQCEGVAVLGTVCCDSSANEDLDFIPLHVEYNEKFYAAGKIPGGFLKREGRPKDREILVSRLIDRPIRPLFSKQFKRDIQVVPTVISVDQVNPPDVFAMNVASAAITISDIPFDGPIGAVRIGYIDGEYVVNPTFEQIEGSVLDILVAGTKDGVTMVEGGGNQVVEEILLEAIEFARKPIEQLCQLQLELRAECGLEKLPLVEDTYQLECHDKVVTAITPKMKEACFVKGKKNRNDAIRALKDETYKEYMEQIPEEKIKYYNALVEDVERDIMRESILKEKARTDGRSPTDIRPITCEVNILPRTHGSALFTRGETQSLSVSTLGTVYDEQIMDDLEGDRRENVMLHYNFPPYSVGETGRLGTGRREIGHGHLAYRAITAVLPSKQDFPYTIRIVSEILESNGSSSMATVCAGSMSLMDAGIPLVKPVAGIAMGMIQEETDVVVISDILGEEDHYGDMDFKVAGTDEGITAFQMDIKVKNVDAKVLKQALEQAKKGRLHILSVMNETIEKSRAELSDYAPRIITFSVDPDQIGMLIGTGGKTIKSVNEKHDVKTNIDDNGEVTIYCKSKSSGEEAQESFLKLLEEPEVGKTYDGYVRRIVDFGAFIEFLPSKEGLCHISRMGAQRIASVNDVLKLNQMVQVRVIEIDKMGRVNLSMIYEGADFSSNQQRPRFDRNDRNDRNDRFDRNDRGGRSDRFDRDRNDRGGRSDRFDRNDRGGGRHDRGDRNDRGGRHDRGDRHDRFDRNDRSRKDGEKRGGYGGGRFNSRDQGQQKDLHPRNR